MDSHAVAGVPAGLDDKIKLPTPRPIHDPSEAGDWESCQPYLGSWHCVAGREIDWRECRELLLQLMETEGQDFLLNWYIWDSFTWPWITSNYLHMMYQMNLKKRFAHVIWRFCGLARSWMPKYRGLWGNVCSCFLLSSKLHMLYVLVVFFYPLSVCQISELGQCHRGLRKKVERKWRQLICMECACNTNHGSFADVTRFLFRSFLKRRRISFILPSSDVGILSNSTSECTSNIVLFPVVGFRHVVRFVRGLSKFSTKLLYSRANNPGGMYSDRT